MTSEFDFYLGIDWATEQHQACIMDSQGQVLGQRKIEHIGRGIVEFISWMEALVQGQVQRIAVAIEVPRGPLVEAFLEHQWTVFAINPKQLDRFRDRHTVTGAKDDSRDAFVLSDSLRTDQHCFRRLSIDHPDITRIRELSRTEENLTVDVRRLVNQLYQLLLRYYPQLLQLCPTPDEPWLWKLLELAPTPQRGANLKPGRIRRLLAQHRIRRWSSEEIAAVLAAAPLPLAAGSVEAASEHVLLLIPQLRLLATFGSRSPIAWKTCSRRWRRRQAMRPRQSCSRRFGAAISAGHRASWPAPSWPKPPVRWSNGITMRFARTAGSPQ